MSIRISEDEREKGRISEKLYVLGRRGDHDRGLLNIGRYYSLDGSLGAPVYLDSTRPHVMLVSGKRGYGKSYTLGIVMEELARLAEDGARIGVLAVDTLGIFWTSRFKNLQQRALLERWGRTPQGIPVRLLVPPDSVQAYRERGVPVRPFTIRTASLTPHHWYGLFGVTPTSPVGIAIARALHSLEGQDYDLREVVTAVARDDRSSEQAKGAAQNFFRLASSWNIFHPRGMPLSEVVQGGAVTVLDVSAYPESLKDVVVAVLAGAIFERRVRARQQDEAFRLGRAEAPSSFPLVWMVIDEAQVFLPRGDTLSKQVLIPQWMRQGRQPGLSLLLATQRPSALDPEVLSHSDLIACHRLTAQQDVRALNKVRPTYMQGDIAEALKKVGTERGVALVIDDTTEAVQVVKVRPRLSWHGGGEPSAVD